MKAGEVFFLGNLVFDEPHDPPYRNLQRNTSGTHQVDSHRCAPNEKFQIERGVQNEIDTLERASSGFGDNDWTIRISKRLSELERKADK